MMLYALEDQMLVGHDGIGIEFVEMKGRVAHCNAYRFDSNTEYVVEQAVLLASREQRSVTPEDLEI